MAQNLAELSVAEQHMVSNLAENWWALVIRGVAGVVFGIAALVWPPGAVTALVLLFVTPESAGGGSRSPA